MILRQAELIELMRPLFVCAKCGQAVEKIALENDPVLLRKRLVAYCHQKIDTLSEHDPRFDTFQQAWKARAPFGGMKITLFQDYSKTASVSVLKPY